MGDKCVGGVAALGRAQTHSRLVARRHKLASQASHSAAGTVHDTSLAMPSACMALWAGEPQLEAARRMASMRCSTSCLTSTAEVSLPSLGTVYPTCERSEPSGQSARQGLCDGRRFGAPLPGLGAAMHSQRSQQLQPS